MNWKTWKYWIGDLLAGAFTGAVVALAHHALVPRSLGILGGVVLGMFVGMGAQMVVSILLGSLLGSMEMMIPGMIVGMLGMLLPALPLRELGVDIGLGAVLGLVVFLGFNVWNALLQGRALRPGRFKSFANTTEKPRQSFASSSGWWNSPGFMTRWKVRAANVGLQRRRSYSKLWRGRSFLRQRERG